MSDKTECPEHRGEPANNCGPCRADALASGGPALTAYLADQEHGRCDRAFAPRYLGARPDHPEVAAWVEQFRTNPKDVPSLLINGPTGTGKTHQAHGALRVAVTAGQRPRVDWRITSAPDLYARLRPRDGVDSETEMHGWRTAGLLLLDDLGAAKASEWTEEITYRLIDHRYTHCLPTILTTNVPTANLREQLGDRVASRLSEMCTRVTLTGGDRRRQRPIPSVTEKE
ncbi:ATP-binding protein [Micromonosporaceae bacterium B7E4]